MCLRCLPSLKNNKAGCHTVYGAQGVQKPPPKKHFKSSTAMSLSRNLTWLFKINSHQNNNGRINGWIKSTTHQPECFWSLICMAAGSNKCVIPSGSTALHLNHLQGRRWKMKCAVTLNVSLGATCWKWSSANCIGCPDRYISVWFCLTAPVILHSSCSRQLLSKKQAADKLSEWLPG